MGVSGCRCRYSSQIASIASQRYLVYRCRMTKSTASVASRPAWVQQLGDVDVINTPFLWLMVNVTSGCTWYCRNTDTCSCAEDGCAVLLEHHHTLSKSMTVASGAVVGSLGAAATACTGVTLLTRASGAKLHFCIVLMARGAARKRMCCDERDGKHRLLRWLVSMIRAEHKCVLGTCPCLCMAAALLCVVQR